LDAGNVARSDVRIVFVIATTHEDSEEPAFIKKNYSWMRYMDLEHLVACGWTPEVHE